MCATGAPGWWSRFRGWNCFDLTGPGDAAAEHDAGSGSASAASGLRKRVPRCAPGPAQRSQRGPAVIEIHATARVSRWADVQDSVRGSRIVIGAHSVLESFVAIKPAGGSGDLIVGAHVVINSGCVLYTGNGICIGNHVAIAANCTLAPVNHAHAERGRLIRAQGFAPSRGGIVIEDDVWIGANSVLLDGARLRRGCVAGAASVVHGELRAYTVYAGRPLRALRERR